MGMGAGRFSRRDSPSGMWNAFGTISYMKSRQVISDWNVWKWKTKLDPSGSVPPLAKIWWITAACTKERYVNARMIMSLKKLSMWIYATCCVFWIGEPDGIPFNDQQGIIHRCSAECHSDCIHLSVVFKWFSEALLVRRGLQPLRFGGAIFAICIRAHDYKFECKLERRT